MADSSSEALVVETDRPGGALAAAASWFSRRGGAREVVVISDFQSGALADGDLAALAAGIGTRMVRVMSTGSLSATQTVRGIEVTVSPERTSAIWPASGGDSRASVTVLAADEDRDALQAAIAAAHSVATRAAGETNRATVVFPTAPTRREMLGQVIPLDSAWQGDVVLALQRNPVLASIAEAANVVPSCETPGTVVARNVGENAIASVANSAGGLRVFACVEPGSLAATALIASLESALAAPAPMRELEPNFLPDETLRRWERPATESAPRGPGETSRDGRWFWVIALAFLVAEEWVRRRSPRREALRVSEVRNERVA
jgi:hypothetical protein